MGGNNSALFGSHKSLTGADYGALGGLAALGGAGLFGLGGGAAAAGAPEVVAGSGSGLLADGLGGGAADELGATSSSIGAAGAPANPTSIAFSNFMSQYGKPGMQALGNAQKGMQLGQAGMNIMGMGAHPTPQMPAARPPAGPAPVPASQILSPPGGSASMVANAIGGGAPQGPGGMSPQMLMLLQQLMQQQGVR